MNFGKVVATMCRSVCGVNRVGRVALRVLLVGVLLLAATATAAAQTDIFIRGAGRLIPLAFPQLCAREGGAAVATEVPQIMGRDLDLSGYFEIVDPKGYIETAGKCGAPEAVAYSDWSVIGAEGLVRGEARVEGDRLKVQLYLHDVQKNTIVLAKEYEAGASQGRMIAHRFANEVMKYYTGEYGVFGTQIAFSGRVGRFKELFVMDLDGSNLRQLTNDRGLAISPAWDPSGSKLVYTSYRNRVPDIFLMDVATKATQQVTRTQELEIGTHFVSPTQIVTSRTEGSDSDLVLLGLDGSFKRRLTPPNRAIDVSAVPSPDGSELLFCSDRGGGPQIYRMGADGSNPRRISFVASKFCSSPAWSPKGDKIAFVCRADGKFQLFVSDPDGGSAIQLTSSGSNEDPEFSPDGRYLVFSSTAFGGAYSLALIRTDGTSMKQLTTSRGGDFEPTWGPLNP